MIKSIPFKDVNKALPVHKSGLDALLDLLQCRLGIPPRDVDVPMSRKLGHRRDVESLFDERADVRVTEDVRMDTVSGEDVLHLARR